MAIVAPLANVTAKSRSSSLSLSRHGRSIDGMDLRSHRLLIAAARWLVAGAAVLAVVGVWAACGRTALGPSAPAGPTAVAASPRPAASGPPLPGASAGDTPVQDAQAQGTPVQGASAGGAPVQGAPAGGTQAAESAGTRGLEAACTVAQFSRLVSKRRLAAAHRLLAGRRDWPWRSLHTIRRIDFISARVWGDSRADVVTLAATVRLTVRRGCPLPGGPTTLYFTLTRDRSAGDWLVKAVRTSP